MACPVDELTKQGYDMQFGSNVLGESPIFSFTTLTSAEIRNRSLLLHGALDARTFEGSLIKPRQESVRGHDIIIGCLPVYTRLAVAQRERWPTQTKLVDHVAVLPDQACKYVPSLHIRPDQALTHSGQRHRCP